MEHIAPWLDRSEAGGCVVQVYKPYLLMNKKRYAGLLWTNPEKFDKMDTKVQQLLSSCGRQSLLRLAQIAVRIMHCCSGLLPASLCRTSVCTWICQFLVVMHAYFVDGSTLAREAKLEGLQIRLYLERSEPGMQGIETVRRDNCQLVRTVVSTCLDRILIEEDIEGAKEYVRNTISDLLMNRMDLSLLVITKVRHSWRDP